MREVNRIKDGRERSGATCFFFERYVNLFWFINNVSTEIFFACSLFFSSSFLLLFQCRIWGLVSREFSVAKKGAEKGLK